MTEQRGCPPRFSPGAGLRALADTIADTPGRKCSLYQLATTGLVLSHAGRAHTLRAEWDVATQQVKYTLAKQVDHENIELIRFGTEAEVITFLKLSGLL